MPDAPWLMTQSLHDVLFAHWRADSSQLRRVVPAAFDLDLFDGEAWLSVVAFYMTNVTLRGMPALPWMSAFPQINVRTYVHVADRPGIYFFSLDAGRRLAVAAARRFLNLPYHTAVVNVERRHDGIHYYSARRARVAAEFRATYGPIDAPFTASAGSLEHFLAERYCLYHHDRRGNPYRLEIHHLPWSLQVARAAITTNTVTAASDLSIAGLPALLHFARRQDMVAWAPVRPEAVFRRGTSAVRH
jgi:uncharacterized protein YqjF (DUF2071 family)